MLPHLVLQPWYPNWAHTSKYHSPFLAFTSPAWWPSLGLGTLLPLSALYLVLLSEDLLDDLSEDIGAFPSPHPLHPSVCLILHRTHSTCIIMFTSLLSV